MMQQILRIKAIIYLFLHLFPMLFFGYISQSNVIYASQQTVVNWEKLPLDDATKKKLKDDNAIYCKSNVESNLETIEKTQSLDYFIAGLHPKNCRIALSKLSQYERFSEFLDFVEKSTYIENQKRIILHLGHTLMPFDMLLDFEIPRIKEPGIYPFRFDKGFLKDLTGEISISEHNNRCLFSTTARWKGPKSRIPDRVFAFFSQALGKNAMETLFRISLTR